MRNKQPARYRRAFPSACAGLPGKEDISQLLVGYFKNNTNHRGLKTSAGLPFSPSSSTDNLDDKFSLASSFLSSLKMRQNLMYMKKSARKLVYSVPAPSSCAAESRLPETVHFSDAPSCTYCLVAIATWPSLVIELFMKNSVLHFPRTVTVSTSVSFFRMGV